MSTKQDFQYPKYLVNTEDDFEALTEYMNGIDLFAFDTETNGKDRFHVRMAGLSLGFDLFAVYIPVLHNEGQQLPLDYVLDGLKPFFKDPNKEKIAHNAKFDEMVLGKYGLEPEGPGHDTIVMLWMVWQLAGRDVGLKQTIKRLFNYQMMDYWQATGTPKPKKNQKKTVPDFATVSLDVARHYGSDDAFWTYKLFIKLREMMKRRKLWDAYMHVEMPFNRVLGHVEAHGVAINEQLLSEADVKYQQLMEELEADIYRAAGKVFNIGSRKQLGEVLFDELKIAKNAPRAPKSGNYKTDAETLERYAPKHQVVKDILRRAKIKKIHGTFVLGLKDFVAKDGKIHPSFNGCGTVTGRLSCSKPNLQQIVGDEVEDVKIRDSFVPEPGHRFVVGDYGQVELRIIAHFSRDKRMIEAFLSGRDFHEETARKMLGIAIDQPVSRQARVIAKTINFGIAYGRGAQSIADQLGISLEEAQGYIDIWFNTFVGVREYRKHIIRQAHQRGFVRTLSGKYRLLPELKSEQGWLRAKGERRAFNTNIQGSGADLIKMAMISLEPKLDPIGAKMCLSIHDELVVQAPEEVVDSTLELVKDTMEHPFNGKNPLRLPLVVDPIVVDSWGDAK